MNLGDLYQELPSTLVKNLIEDIRKRKSKNVNGLLRTPQNILLGLSNPNFEFYLLLHLTNVKDKDAEEIAINKRMSKSKSSRKYSEHLLNEEMKKFDLSYQKKNYDAHFFIERFNDVVQNSSYYQQDNKLLKDEIGTSVPNIIKDLI